MSLLFLVLLACSCAGSYGTYKEVCYGSDLILPLSETPLLDFLRGWFFLPTKPGTHRHPVSDRIRLSTSNGTALDPRYEISSSKFIIRDVTETDAGFFSYEELIQFTLFRVVVKDCSSKVTKTFGSDYYYIFPANAYSLDFMPGNNLDSTYGLQSQVVWHVSIPNSVVLGGKGQKQNNKWTMRKLTYDYVGYYTFRDQNRKMLNRHRMDIEEDYSYVEKNQREELAIKVPMEPKLFHLTFKPENRHAVKTVLMKAGKLQWHDNEMFKDRIYLIDEMLHTLHISIEDLQPSDSGTYELTDLKGNKAVVMTVEVKAVYPPYVRYIVAAVCVLAVVLCCCYVKRRLCGRSRRRKVRRAPPVTETAPDFQDDDPLPSTSDPSGPYPLGPYHTEPGSTFQVPGPEAESQPEAPTTTASMEPPTYDSLFPDAGPQFEVRGATPSAPPLSSDTPDANVYTSSKLNFM